MGGAGTMLIRATFLQDATRLSRPMVAVDNSFSCPPLEEGGPQADCAVEAESSADGGAAALRDIARQLADDLDHQFGIRASTIPGVL
nr:hypothetical protein GCM10017745_67900 [Saccharothrix mutabilis subsp. capreolus]